MSWIRGELLGFDQMSRLLEADFGKGMLFWKLRTSDLLGVASRDAEHRCNNWNSRFAGTEAFTSTRPDGYKVGTVNYVKCRAHRVIWLLAHGEWPTDQIDHINGNRGDNRIANLRPATFWENARNQKRRSTNKSGVQGVVWDKAQGKWQARITADNRQRHLGYFDRFEDAVARRKAEELALNFHPNHGRAA